MVRLRGGHVVRFDYHQSYQLAHLTLQDLKSNLNKGNWDELIKKKVAFATRIRDMNDNIYGHKLQNGIKQYHRELQYKLQNEKGLVPVRAIGTLKDNSISSVTSNVVGAFIHAHYLSADKNIVVHYGAYEQSKADTRKSNNATKITGQRGVSQTVDHGDSLYKNAKDAGKSDYGKNSNPADSLQSKIIGLTGKNGFRSKLRSSNSAGTEAVIAHLKMEELLASEIDKHYNLTQDRRPTTVVDYHNIQSQNLDEEVDAFVSNQKDLVEQLGGEELFYEKIQAQLESENGLAINKKFERRPVRVIHDISSLKKIIKIKTKCVIYVGVTEFW